MAFKNGEQGDGSLMHEWFHALDMIDNGKSSLAIGNDVGLTEEVRQALADVRKAIMDGYVLGTTNQDPYPQAFEGMHMAWLYLNGMDADIPKPLNLPLPIITKQNAEATPPAWGC